MSETHGACQSYQYEKCLKNSETLFIEKCSSFIPLDSSSVCVAAIVGSHALQSIKRCSHFCIQEKQTGVNTHTHTHKVSSICRLYKDLSKSVCLPGVQPSGPSFGDLMSFSHQVALGLDFLSTRNVRAHTHAHTHTFGYLHTNPMVWLPWESCPDVPYRLPICIC